MTDGMLHVCALSSGTAPTEVCYCFEQVQYSESWYGWSNVRFVIAKGRGERRVVRGRTKHFTCRILLFETFREWHIEHHGTNLSHLLGYDIKYILSPQIGVYMNRQAYILGEQANNLICETA